MGLPIFSLSDFNHTNSGKALTHGGIGRIDLLESKRKLSENISHGEALVLKTFRKGQEPKDLQNWEQYLNLLDSNLKADGNYFISRIAKPIGIVRNKEDKYLGYVMKLFTKNCIFKQKIFEGGTTERLNQLSYFLLSGAERSRFEVPTIDLNFAFALIKDYLGTMDRLHDRQIYVGDVSSYNLVVQMHPSQPRMIFLDVDSFWYKNSKHPLPAEETPLWEAPENVGRSRAIRSEATDVYKSALVIRRLLHQVLIPDNSCEHITKSRPVNTLIRNKFGRNAVETFNLSFSDDPKQRPKIYKLREVFEK
jgi:hypothetical protein